VGGIRDCLEGARTVEHPIRKLGGGGAPLGETWLPQGEKTMILKGETLHQPFRSAASRLNQTRRRGRRVRESRRHICPLKKKAQMSVVEGEARRFWRVKCAVPRTAKTGRIRPVPVKRQGKRIRGRRSKEHVGSAFPYGHRRGSSTTTSAGTRKKGTRNAEDKEDRRQGP